MERPGPRQSSRGVPKLLEHVVQFLRQRRLETHRLTRRRMSKGDARAVEKWTVHRGEHFQIRRHLRSMAAIERVADDRMTALAEVHTDLMRAAGANPDTRQ